MLYLSYLSYFSSYFYVVIIIYCNILYYISYIFLWYICLYIELIYCIIFIYQIYRIDYIYIIFMYSSSSSCSSHHHLKSKRVMLCFYFSQARLLLRRLDDLKEGAESTRESMEINEADFRWQRHVLSSEQPGSAPAQRSPDVSISVTTETGQTTLGLEAEPGLGVGPGLGHASPEECGEEPRLPSPSSCGEPEEVEEEGGGGGRRDRQREVGGGERGGAVPPDVVQRSHALVYPDITNFLSVESRCRAPPAGGSRYSESNFRWGENFPFFVISPDLSYFLFDANL